MKIQKAKNKKIKMKIVALIILSMITIMILFTTFYTGYKPSEPESFATNRIFLTHSDLLFKYEITRYPSGAEVVAAQPVEEKITVGVVVDPWNLHFGVIPAGDNFGTRFIDLTNLRERGAKISLKVYGNISPFVEFSKNDFILHKNENVTVAVNFYAKSAKIGNYSGEIDVIVQRPRYDFLYALWK